MVATLQSRGLKRETRRVSTLLKAELRGRREWLAPAQPTADHASAKLADGIDPSNSSQASRRASLQEGRRLAKSMPFKDARTTVLSTRAGTRVGWSRPLKVGSRSASAAARPPIV